MLRSLHPSLLLAGVFTVLFMNVEGSAQDLTQWTLEGVRFADGADPTAALLPDGRVRIYSFSNSPPGPSIISATSTDGLTFALDAGIRLPQTASFFAGSGGPLLTRVIPVANGQWRMFFSTGGGSGGIGSAISSDGLNFTIESGLRITATAASAPNGTDGGTVVKLLDGTFRTYFGVMQPAGVIGRSAILSATSTDMLNWTIDPGIRLGAGSAVGDLISSLHPTPPALPTGIKVATSTDGLTFTSEIITSVSGTTGNCQPCGDPTVYPLPDGRLRIYYDNFNPATNITSMSSATSVQRAPGIAALAAAVLPSSRSVQVGATATAFATIVNSGLGAGISCGIAPVPSLSLSFTCANSAPAPITTGLDTLLLAASATPVPDIVG